ncbi:hypothetical protein [Streptomyces sp. NPDC018045]|uniref:hypothetical protein n=2 Tax=unclassified Streptomyces TaxID=2593676 RepID=UPI0037AB1E6F
METQPIVRRVFVQCGVLTLNNESQLYRTPTGRLVAAMRLGTDRGGVQRETVRRFSGNVGEGFMRFVKTGVAAAAALVVAVAVPAAGQASGDAEKTAPQPRALTAAEVKAEKRPCGLSVDQPGGTGAPAWIYWNNCWADNHGLSETPVFSNGKGNTYTYVRVCQYIAPGHTEGWYFPAGSYPPEPTSVTGVTYCK